MNPTHGSTLPKKKFGLVETLVHTALAMPATLAALGTIFQAFPALCPCEPRLPRGEMQAVPCGARSITRLLPASTSQPPPTGIRSVRKYNTGICLFVQVKSVLTFRHIWLPHKRKKIHWVNHALRRFRPCLDERPRARRESAGRFTLVCTHAPTSRSGAETAQGGAPPNPTLIRSTCILLLLLLYVVATTAAVLLLRTAGHLSTNTTTKNKKL